MNGLSVLRGYVTHHHSSIITDIDVDAARTHTNHWFSSKISKSFVASLAMLMCPSPSESHSSYEANKCQSVYEYYQKECYMIPECNTYRPPFILG